MENLIEYALPGNYEHYKTNLLLLMLYKNFPEYFKENTKIGCVYGCFQFCTWDGGRTFKEERHATLEEAMILKDWYMDFFKVPVRFIYTNAKIQEPHLYDRFNNIITSLYHDEQNEIVINSPILKQYIQEYYPKYSLISSTTKCITNLQSIKEEINNPEYKYICLDYNLNHNFKFLDQFTQEEKNKTEFLVNAYCSPGCPLRKEHYNFSSQAALFYGKKFSLRGCNISHVNLNPIKHENNIFPDEINKYVNKNFSHFKIEGRTTPELDALITAIYYLIKPEFQMAVFIALSRFFEIFNLETFDEHLFIQRFFC